MATPISFSGFNNIDFKSVVNIIIQSESQPITDLQNSQQAEKDRLSAYGTLNTNLSSLQSALDGLSSDTAYGNLQASSSDTTTLDVAATSSASKGTFAINVTSLARPQVTTSPARQFNDINAQIIDGGTFSITQNNTATSIDLTGVKSLVQLRDAINAQQTGVKASIVNDGSTDDIPPKPFRLILTSATPGVSNAFTVSDQTTMAGGAAGSVLNLSTDPVNGVARDTQLDYNGIPVRSSSTTVTDAIPGLSLHVLKTGSTTVTITDDDSGLKDKIRQFVDAFNKFNDFVQGQMKPPASGTDRPPLSTDPMLRGINRQIRSFLTASQANTGSIKNAAVLGLKLNQSGKLELDESALDAALAANPSDVKAFFSGPAGFATKVGDYIESYTQAGGAIDSVEKRIQATVDNYGTRIVNMQAQLALRQDDLTKQFTAADEAISQLNSQSSAINSLGSQYRLF